MINGSHFQLGTGRFLWEQVCSPDAICNLDCAICCHLLVPAKSTSGMVNQSLFHKQTTMGTRHGTSLVPECEVDVGEL